MRYNQSCKAQQQQKRNMHERQTWDMRPFSGGRRVRDTQLSSDAGRIKLQWIVALRQQIQNTSAFAQFL
jgi:hypothetical protein